MGDKYQRAIDEIKRVREADEEEYKRQQERKNIVKNYMDITDAEWILFEQIPVTAFGDSVSRWMRGQPRPLAEAMKLAGGTIKDLRPYMWALDDNSPVWEQIKDD